MIFAYHTNINMLKSDFLDILFRKKNYEAVSKNERYNRELDKCEKEGIEIIHLEQIIPLIKESDKYEIFMQSMNSINEDLIYDSDIHGISHNERVSVLAFSIGMLEGVSDRDLQILLEAAKYHDIGRIDDSEDEEHGYNSSQMLDKISLNFSEEELKMLKTICICHSIDDIEFDDVSKSMDVSDIERCRNLLNILKDADALDRVRLRVNGLDTSFLRTESSKKMVPAAYELFYNYNCIKKEIEQQENLEFPENMFFYEDEIFTLLPEQLEILKKQWKIFNKFKGFDVKNKGLIINENGQVVFEVGTLIHGTGNFDEKKLRSISKTGILPCEFIGEAEENETFYCADFMRVPTEQTMDEYKKDKDNSAMGRIPFAKTSSSVAFIINPSEEIEEFLSADVYSKQNDDNENLRKFFNLFADVIQRYLGERRGFASAIVGGIPASCISGVLVGRNVEKSQIEVIKGLFPECYIIDSDNVVIYDSSLQTKGSYDYEMQRNNIKLQDENDELRKTLGKSKEAERKSREMVDKILDSLRGKISNADLKEIYTGVLGWQSGPSWLENALKEETAAKSVIPAEIAKVSKDEEISLSQIEDAEGIVEPEEREPEENSDGQKGDE